jgi:hypothetical protein
MAHNEEMGKITAADALEYRFWGCFHYEGLFW